MYISWKMSLTIEIYSKTGLKIGLVITSKKLSFFAVIFVLAERG